MTFEIVDGMTGTKHISSDDLSALNIATIGESNCVLNYGNNFKLTMTNANTATLGTGVGMVGGKRFWNQAATSLTVQSGTQGQKRNDLVVARYAKTSAGIESITPVVIKGTPTTGTAADPEVTANDLKLWRVPLNGISVGEPVKLFEPVASLATIGDSVSQGRDPSLDRSGNAGGWDYSLVHIERDNYMLTIKRTLNPTPAYVEFTLPFHLEITVRLCGRLMVATTYVGTTTAFIDTNGIVQVSGSGYGAPSTTELYGLVILA